MRSCSNLKRIDIFILFEQRTPLSKPSTERSTSGRPAPLGIMPAMKAHVWVMLKTTVLDPQGKTIQHALASLGYAKVTGVRQGKFFVLDIDGANREEARVQVERIAKEVLTNPVIEEFRFEIVD